MNSRIMRGCFSIWKLLRVIMSSSTIVRKKPTFWFMNWILKCSLVRWFSIKWRKRISYWIRNIVYWIVNAKGWRIRSTSISKGLKIWLISWISWRMKKIVLFIWRTTRVCLNRWSTKIPTLNKKKPPRLIIS